MKPMLAPNDVTVLEDIKWPKLGSYKIDGVRATVRNGVLVSRTLKPIPNKYVQSLFSRPEFEGLDGELVVGLWTGSDVCNRTTSGVMRHSGEPDVHWHVFDVVDQTRAFQPRHKEAQERALQASLQGHPISGLQHTPLLSLAEMQAYEEIAVTQGFEGIMLRDPIGPYKFGRATQKENTLLKIKRWLDSEGEVTAIHEGSTNNNPKFKDELGHSKRKTLQENIVPNGTLGSFSIRDIHTGLELDVSSGILTQIQSKEIWDNREKYMGKTLTYKYMPAIKDKPRFPSFKNWRNSIDIVKE